jgi:hypothetical protein
MHEFRDALRDFQELQQQLLCHRPSPQRPHNYAEVRCTAQRKHPLAPRLATHYSPTHHSAFPTSTTDAELLFVYAASETGLPIHFTPDEATFIIDTGASISITYDKSDFDNDIEPVQPTMLKGIAAGLSVQGIGNATYHFTTPDGTILPVTLRNILYVPQCKVCLLCPRHLAASTDRARDGFNSEHDEGILTCHGHQIPVPYHSKTGLPLITTTAGIQAFVATLPDHDPKTAQISSLSTKKHLTIPQQMKLLLHERCNHRNFADINRWIRNGLLNVNPTIASAPDPICSACQFGKAHRKSHKSDIGSITAEHTYTGAGVSSKPDIRDESQPPRVYPLQSAIVTAIFG